MRERINRLARGILTAEVPELSVSPEEIAGEVRSGEVFRTFICADSGSGLTRTSHLKRSSGFCMVHSAQPFR